MKPRLSLLALNDASFKLSNKSIKFNPIIKNIKIKYLGEIIMNNMTVIGIVAILLLAGIGVYSSITNEPQMEKSDESKTQTVVIKEKNSDINLEHEKEADLLMTSLELADYLGITIEELNSIGPDTGNNSLELPYMTIDNTIYYSRPAIDVWLLQGVAPN